VAAFFAVLITTHLLDKYKRRGIFMLIGTSLSIVGYIMLISTGRPLIPVRRDVPCWGRDLPLLADSHGLAG
jgi:hypothetical protein